MSSTRNDMYNPSYSKTWLSRKSRLRNWFLCFKSFFFSHFEELKSTFFTSFHFAPWGMY